jgi:hypothetical protein
MNNAEIKKRLIVHKSKANTANNYYNHPYSKTIHSKLNGSFTVKKYA